jgi:hypothetical protein
MSPTQNDDACDQQNVERPNDPPNQTVTMESQKEESKDKNLNECDLNWFIVYVN